MKAEAPSVPMNRQSWEKARSELCHDWIKNGMLVALSKMRNILLGTVADVDGANDLLDLLDDAQNHLTVAKRLIAIAPDALSPASPTGSANSVLSTSAPEMRIIVALWEQKSGITEAGNRSNSALLEVTKAVRRTRKILLERADVVSGTPGPSLDSIQRLDAAFRELALALADLSRVKAHF